jgi:hypothetical protein
MKYFIRLFGILLFTLYSGAIYGQNGGIEGLWTIENVHVSNRDMTPVAKWTRIKADGTYESVNGWLKNSEGTWTYDEAGQNFLPKETNGLIDPYGAFSVRFEGKKMKWMRTEEGHEVTITLARIHEIPRSPADKVQGLWGLDKAMENGKDITQTYDPQNKRYLFLRWDRMYIQRTADGTRQNGYWQMNAHKPEITFINREGKHNPLSWKVTFMNDKKITLTGISDFNKGQTLIYNRLNSFPE